LFLFKKRSKTQEIQFKKTKGRGNGGCVKKVEIRKTGEANHIKRFRKSGSKTPGETVNQGPKFDVLNQRWEGEKKLKRGD